MVLLCRNLLRSFDGLSQYEDSYYYYCCCCYYFYYYCLRWFLAKIWKPKSYTLWRDAVFFFCDENTNVSGRSGPSFCHFWSRMSETKIKEKKKESKLTDAHYKYQSCMNENVWMRIMSFCLCVCAVYVPMHKGI